uniref:Uncharacterized protein n=1 Tax=viral metagenome TaxID=1070528 RepID=A0A6C0AEL6_9ZZZZ
MKLKDIPQWLKNGNLYQSFLEDEEELNIEDKFIKSTSEIKNIKDFIDVFNISQYWNIDYPDTFYEYALDNKFEVLKFFFSEHDNKNKEIDFLIKELMESEKIIYEFTPFSSINSYYKQYGKQFYHLTLIINKSIIRIPFRNIKKNGSILLEFFDTGYNVEKTEIVFQKIIDDKKFNHHVIKKLKDVIFFENAEYSTDKTKITHILKVTKFNKKHISECFKNILKEMYELPEVPEKYLMEKEKFNNLCESI